MGRGVDSPPWPLFRTFTRKYSRTSLLRPSVGPGVKSVFYAGLHPGEPASIHEKEKRTFFSLIVQKDCDDN